LRVEVGAVVRGPGGETLDVDGRRLPFLRLPAALQAGAVARPASAWSVMVVRSGDQAAAVGVERLRGVRAVVVHSLPRLPFLCPLAAGAAFDGEGQPQLVLSPAGLVAAGREERGVSTETAAAPRAPILVIDDSLTTRMLEQS